MLLLAPTQKIIQFCLFCCIAVIGSSCIPNKQLVYFPDRDFNTIDLTNIDNKPEEYKLQPRDIISVRIKTLDNESSEYFNIQPQNAFMNLNQASVFLSSYSIDDNGDITLPEAGLVKVGALTVQEAQQKIQESTSVYLNKATILVKLVSFKITVLGEVQKPGHFYIYNDQLTVLEGLGLAGDLTDFGNRENITLLRQTNSGVGAVLIDLKNPQLLSSKYYYLQPNDVIYVQPLKAKSARANFSALSTMSVIFGAISTTILILTFIN